MKTKSKNLTASKLRIILSLTLFLIIGAAVGGFSYARTILSQYSVEVSHKKVDAQASSGNISSLEEIKRQLANDQDVITKANALKSANEFPEFAIVDEVTHYANQNGLAIESFDFSNSSTATSGGAPATPATPGTVTPGAKTSKNGVYISVTLKAPVDYAKLLQFMSDLDQSLPKMQIQGINIGPDTKSINSVIVQPIVIQMYTR